jgi:hypothetical protein
MEDGRLLLLAVRVNDPERRFATIPRIAEQEADEVEDLLRRAGFRDLRVEEWAGRHPLLHETARFILAQR